MIKMSNPMNRRTLLRGAGVALSLPVLEAMVPTAKAADAVKQAKRFQAFYLPNGMMMEDWTPEAEGKDYALSRTLSPLQPFKDKITVVSGLGAPPHQTDRHAAGCAGFLTGAHIKNTDGYDVLCGTSIDQMLARTIGRETTLPSLELGLEQPSMTGTCVVSYSCAYTNTLSWRDETTPIPVTHNPRDVFERLFGDGDTVDPRSRLVQLKREASILDFVMDDARRVSQRVGIEDNRKLDQYMDAVRDIELRIQKASNSDRGVVTTDLERPSGVPDSFKDHIRLMIDLQVIAMQTDLTRVGTFMIGRELSNRAYPELDVPDAHHMLSHHINDPIRMAKVQKINQYHMEQFAYYLQRMIETKEAGGSLLDNTFVMIGAGFGDPDRHDITKMPTVVAGGLAQGGQHFSANIGSTRTSVLVAALQKMGIENAVVADTSSPLTEVIA